MFNLRWQIVCHCCKWYLKYWFQGISRPLDSQGGQNEGLFWIAWSLRERRCAPLFRVMTLTLNSDRSNNLTWLSSGKTELLTRGYTRVSLNTYIIIRLSPELKQISCKSKSASIEVNYYQSLLSVPHGTYLHYLRERDDLLFSDGKYFWLFINRVIVFTVIPLIQIQSTTM